MSSLEKSIDKFDNKLEMLQTMLTSLATEAQEDKDIPIELQTEILCRCAGAFAELSGGENIDEDELDTTIDPTESFKKFKLANPIGNTAKTLNMDEFK